MALNTDNHLQDDRLIHRLDLRLLPWLSLLTLAGFLDRTNMGNAKIKGLQEALGLTNSQYNASLTIFFIPYALFELFTNVLLKRMGPKLYIPSIMLTWVSTYTNRDPYEHPCSIF
jgi:fucose permease